MIKTKRTAVFKINDYDKISGISTKEAPLDAVTESRLKVECDAFTPDDFH